MPHNVVPVPCTAGWCPVMWAGALNVPEGAVIPCGLAPLTTHRFIRSAIYLPCQALALTCAKEEKHLCPTAAPGLQSCFVTLLARCDPSAERRRRAAAPLRAAVRGSAAAATLQGYRVCWCQLCPAFPPHIPERRSQAWMSRPCPPYALFFFFFASPAGRVWFERSGPWGGDPTQHAGVSAPVCASPGAPLRARCVALCAGRCLSATHITPGRRGGHQHHQDVLSRSGRFGGGLSRSSTDCFYWESGW